MMPPRAGSLERAASGALVSLQATARRATGTANHVVFITASGWKETRERVHLPPATRRPQSSISLLDEVLTARSRELHAAYTRCRRMSHFEARQFQARSLKAQEKYKTPSCRWLPARRAWRKEKLQAARIR